MLINKCLIPGTLVVVGMSRDGHVCMYMLIFVFVDCSCLWGTGYSTGSTCTVCVPGVHACTVSKT